MRHNDARVAPGRPLERRQGAGMGRPVVADAPLPKRIDLSDDRVDAGIEPLGISVVYGRDDGDARLIREPPDLPRAFASAPPVQACAARTSANTPGHGWRSRRRRGRAAAQSAGRASSPPRRATRARRARSAGGLDRNDCSAVSRLRIQSSTRSSPHATILVAWACRIELAKNLPHGSTTIESFDA